MTLLPDLRAWLERHSDPGTELRLTRAEVAAIQAELSRLRQSNEMLRKQNRKVRGKVARLHGTVDDESADEAPGDDPVTPSNDS